MTRTDAERRSVGVANAAQTRPDQTRGFVVGFEWLRPSILDVTTVAVLVRSWMAADAAGSRCPR